MSIISWLDRRFRQNLQDEIQASGVLVKKHSFKLRLEKKGKKDENPQSCRDLGPGPMRFASSSERDIADQIKSLRFFHRESFESIKRSWEIPRTRDHFNGGPLIRHEERVRFDDAAYLQFAMFNDFDQSKTLKHMHHFNLRYLSLRCVSLEKQLSTNTLFPVPGLETRDGLECFYMRPSNYFPHQTPVVNIIDNLVYVLQCMEEKEFNCRMGVAFIANMAGWKRENFAVEYCHEFMKALMGQHSPLHIKLFLIVDPPSWFESVWRIMRQVLTKEFRKTVRLIQSKDIGDYLADGYEEFLPSDMSGGRANTAEMVQDFITYRKYVEVEKGDFSGTGDFIPTHYFIPR